MVVFGCFGRDRANGWHRPCHDAQAPRRRRRTPVAHGEHLAAPHAVLLAAPLCALEARLAGRATGTDVLGPIDVTGGGGEEDAGRDASAPAMLLWHRSPLGSVATRQPPLLLPCVGGSPRFPEALSIILTYAHQPSPGHTKLILVQLEIPVRFEIAHAVTSAWSSTVGGSTGRAVVSTTESTGRVFAVANRRFSAACAASLALVAAIPALSITARFWW